MARFEAVDCCFSPVLDLAQALNTPHLIQRQLVRREGCDVQALFPALLDGELPPMRARLRAVSIGEARLAFATRGSYEGGNS
jgi:alpha-methylacyl-CoA racemase